MYPNPQDVLPLPPNPSAEHYRKRAKELAKASRAGGDAVHAWVAIWVDDPRRARQLTDFATERLGTTGRLADAQFVLARVHGFASWTRFARHLEEVATRASGDATFEQAVDAIVTGDLATLVRLLAAEPSLVTARSSRDHSATLLHYVSANGVENYRQRSPANAVAIAERLLHAGAAVDAECDVYGGGATTLGLVVTSTPPRQAGVQLQLAELLLARGARVDARIVRSCLMNGCPEAAARMAEVVTQRGGTITLEEAAGIGRVDLVARYFEGGAPASHESVKVLLMAAWYDRLDVVTFLLDRGVDAGARAAEDGNTALHIAAYQASEPLVALLLARGAPVHVRDGTHDATPIAWALHGWLEDARQPAGEYRGVLLRLAESGATVTAEMIDDERIRADGVLHAALRATLR